MPKAPSQKETNKIYVEYYKKYQIIALEEKIDRLKTLKAPAGYIKKLEDKLKSLKHENQVREKEGQG